MLLQWTPAGVILKILALVDADHQLSSPAGFNVSWKHSSSSEAVSFVTNFRSVSFSSSWRPLHSSLRLSFKHCSPRTTLFNDSIETPNDGWNSSENSSEFVLSANQTKLKSKTEAFMPALLVRASRQISTLVSRKNSKISRKRWQKEEIFGPRRNQ